MKAKNLIFTLIASIALLASCGTPETDSGIPQNDFEIQSHDSSLDVEAKPGSPYTRWDVEFNGVQDPEYYYFNSRDYKLEGQIDQFGGVSNWLVTGYDYKFDIKPKKGPAHELTVIIGDTSILQYECNTSGLKPAHYLKGLKTGSTKVLVYTAEKGLVFRSVVNVRTKIDDDALIFSRLGSADKWSGVLTNDAYRLYFELGPSGYYDKGTFTYNDGADGSGTITFTVKIDTRVDERFDGFNNWSYELVATDDPNINLTNIAIDKSLSSIILVASEGGVDIFRPVFFE